DHAARQPSASTTPTHSRPARDIAGNVPAPAARGAGSGAEAVERQRPDLLLALVHTEDAPRARAVLRVPERERERGVARVALPEDLPAAPRAVGDQRVRDGIPADDRLLVASADDAQRDLVPQLRLHRGAIGL